MTLGGGSAYCSSGIGVSVVSSRISDSFYFNLHRGLAGRLSTCRLVKSFQGVVIVG